MRKLLEKFGYKPRNSVWEITLRCNMRCLHCGSSAGLSREEELSTAEALDMADQLAGIGLEMMTLSGGEPLLHPDWDKIGERLINNGVAVNMITNGTLITDEVIARAKKIGMKNMVFSFDGVKEVHDLIRNVPGAYEKLLAAFDCCRRNDFPFSVVTMVHNRNVDNLADIYETLKEYGAFAWQLQIGTPMGNFAHHPGLYVHPEGLPRVLPSIAAIIDHARDEGNMRMYVADCTGYYGPYEEALRKENELGFWYGCVAGCHIIGVEADGGIKGCLSMQSQEFTVDNVRNRPLGEIWGDDDLFAFNRKFEVSDLSGFCGGCRYAEICRGGCKWNAHLTTGGLGDNKYCFHRVSLELAGYESDPGEEELPEVPLPEEADRSYREMREKARLAAQRSR